MTLVRPTSIVALACAALSTGAAIAAPKYHVTDLGVAWESGTPTAINESGQVVGRAWSGQVLLYSGGVTTNLGTLGGDVAGANAVNDTGAIVGQSSSRSTGFDTAFELVNGKSKALGTLGDPGTAATGINNKGQVVGTSRNAAGATRAFLSAKGVMRDLGFLPGGTWSAATAINKTGVVTGSAETGTGSRPAHAFRVVNGTMTDIGALSPDAASRGFAISDKGAVTGEAAVAPGPAAVTHAFVSTASGMRDLGTLAPPGVASYSAGLGINAAGRVVGWSWTNAFGSRAAMMSDATGMYDLNRLQDGQSPGWTLYSATAINDAGQIVGVGSFGESLHAFLLTPVK